jgi:hypothetical protein
MSATRILAQSNPALLNAFPGWKQPTHCRLMADIGATGAVVARAASTTPGVSIVRDDVGQYTVSFPPCRDIAGIVVNLYSTAPETADGASYATIDANTAETLATLGQFKFHTRRANDGNNEDPPSGDDMDITFWLDLG